MRSPITRPSNVAGMLLAGRYLFCATADDPGQAVRVDYEDGLPLATVLDGEDAGEVLDARDMRGEFRRLG